MKKEFIGAKLLMAFAVTTLLSACGQGDGNKADSQNPQDTRKEAAPKNETAKEPKTYPANPEARGNTEEAEATIAETEQDLSGPALSVVPPPTLPRVLSQTSSSVAPPLTAEQPDFFIPTPSYASEKEENPLRVLVVTAEHKGDHETGGLGAMVRFYQEALNARPDTRADLLSIYYMSYYQNQELQQQLKREDQSYFAFLDFYYLTGELTPNYERTAKFDVYSRPIADGKSKAIYLRHDNPWGTPNYFDNVVEPGERKRYTPEHCTEWVTQENERQAFGSVNIAMSEYIRDHASEYDVIVFNDWHVGLVPYFLYNPYTPQASWQTRRNNRGPKQLPPSLFIIHNAAHQGWYGAHFIDKFGANSNDFNEGRIRKDGLLNSVWTGLLYTTVSRTVSRTHAEEIRKYPRLGRGLEALVNWLKERGRWTGMINGIPKKNWNIELAEKHGSEFRFTIEDYSPKKGPLPQPTGDSPRRITGKDRGKALLQEYFGLDIDSTVPVIVMGARLDKQKGYDFLLHAVESVLRENRPIQPQFVFLGDGDRRYREWLKHLISQREFKGRISWKPFSDEGEKLALTFGTFLLAPSINEPSGQVHLFGKPLGTPFIGTLVGGPVESIEEGKTGFFSKLQTHWAGDSEIIDEGYCIDELKHAIHRALDVYSDPKKMREMIYATMQDAKNYSWESLISQERELFKYVISNGQKDKFENWNSFPQTF
jgi:starch synthase